MSRIEAPLKTILLLLKIQEDKALHKNTSFWFAILAPLIIIIWIFYLLTNELILKEAFYINMSSESLAAFVKHYAFPITLLTLPLTFGVMVNRFHSSKQKAKTNNLVERNNIVNNFFTHYKNFSEFCDKIEQRYNSNKLTLTPEFLYRDIFPTSGINNFTTTADSKFISVVIDKIDKEITQFINHSNKVGYNNISNTRVLKERYRYNSVVNGLNHSILIDTDHQLHTELTKAYTIAISLVFFIGTSNSAEIYNQYHLKFKQLMSNRFYEEKDNIFIDDKNDT